ncbi:two-partner secretion domain-containing protein [Acinetobacter nosocomialis]|uniref:two-partner secretion domain-containing protein n=4 Tax=Acinetobacter nosocomialis TaxID=106654 RepID=UPI00374F7745
MNKNRYRIIFSHARGMFIAVAEIVKSKTKQAGQSQGVSGTDSTTVSVLPIHYKKLNPLNFAVIGCLGALVIILPMSSVAETQISADKGAPTSQQPTILTSANGTTQVNIQTPSAGGVSRNTYTQFDVGQEGAILNNSRNNTQTQLGGWVQGNPWLAKGEAKVILNEVNSNNPSQLKGYIEVAGKQAQVVIANPSGLICDGCGVINADRFTLTTGQAVMNQGYLESFRVREGQVTIDGKGLNGSLTPYTDIYARALKVNAGLYANELNTVLGQNDIQVKDQVAPQITATTGPTTTPPPNFALDVGQLGGMYAGKIFLVGTEQGLGVRNAGTINSTQGTLTLNANGDLVNNGNLIANKDQVQLKAQNIQNTGNVSSATSQTSIESQNLDNSGLISSADELHLQNESKMSNSGTLNAARIAITSTTLKNIGSIEQTGLQGLDLKSGSMTNLGGKIGVAKSNTSGGTAGNSSGNTGSTVIVPTVPVDSAQDGGSLGVVSPIDTTPKTYDIGFIHVSGVLGNDQGTIIANGGVDLESQNGLDNQGGQLNLGTVTIKGSNFNNDLGQLNVKQADIQTLDFTNQQGQFASSSTLKIQSQNANNQSGKIQSIGQLDLAIGSELNNSKGYIASSDNVQVSAGDLSNQFGVIYSENQSVNIKANQAIDNTEGFIQAKTDLNLNSQALNNTSGHIIGNQIKQQHGTVNNSQGAIIAKQNLNSTAQQFDNDQGQLQATTVQLQHDQLKNTGGIYADKNLTVTGKDIQNSGSFAAGENVKITSSALEHAQNGLIAAGLDREGKLADTGMLTINVDRADLHGQTFAGGNIQVDATRTINAAQGQLQSKTIALNAGTDISTQAATVVAQDQLKLTSQNLINNQQGQLNSQDIILSAQQLDNSQGKIQHTGNNEFTLNFVNGLNNKSGEISSNAVLMQLNTSILNNEAGQIIHSGNQQLNINSNQLQGAQGKILSNGQLVLATEQAILDGAITSADQINITAYNLSHQKGQMIQRGTLKPLTLAITDQINNQLGFIQSPTALYITAGSLNNQGGQLSSAAEHDLQLDVAGLLDNSQSGQIYAGLNNNIHASSINNSMAGKISAQNALTLTSLGLINNNSGKIIANADVGISSQGLNNDAGEIGSVEGKLILNAGTGVLSNQSGTLQSGKDIKVQAGQLKTQSGLINAQGSIEVTAGQDIDNSSGQIIANKAVQLSSQGLANNAGQIGSVEGTVNIDAGTGVLSNQQGKLQSSQDLTLKAQGIDNQSGLIATQAKLDMQQQWLNNSKGQILSGTALTFVGQDLINQGGLLQSGADLNFKLSGLFDNSQSGQLYSGGNTEIQAGSVKNSEQGKINAQGVLNIDAVQGINNTQGVMASTQQMSLKSQGLQNDGGQIGTEQGDVLIQTGGLSLNNGSGAIQSGKTLTLDVNSLNNSGVISALDRLTLNSQGDVTNDHGKLLSNKQLQVSSQNLSNRSGVMQSGADSALDVVVNGTLDNSHAGSIQSGAALNLQVNALTNSQQGQISAQDALNIISAGLIDNEAGSMVANQNISLSGQGLNNRQGQIGSIQGGLSVDAGNQAVDNQSGLLQSKTDLTVKALSLDSTAGQMTSQAKIDLQSQQEVNNTQGVISADQGIEVNSQGLNNQKGQIGTQGHLTLQVENLTLNNQAGLLQAGQDLIVDAASIDNSLSGKISAQGQATLQTTGLLNNQTGAITANQDITLTSYGLNNTQGQIGSVAGSLNLEMGDQVLNNQSGSLLSGQHINIHASGLNNNQGQIIARQILDIDTELQELNNKQGLISADTANIRSGTLNNDQGLIQTNNVLSIDTQSHDLINTHSGSQGGLLSQGNLTLKNLATIDNTQGYIASGQTLDITANQVQNGSGTLLAAQNLKLQGSGQNQLLNNQSGQLLSMGDMSLNIDRINNAGKVNTTDTNSHIMAAGQLNISTQQLDNQNTALINSGTSVQGIDAGSLNLNALAVDNQSGVIRSSKNSQLDISQQLNNQFGEISAVEQLGIQGNSLAINNQKGKLLAGENLNIAALSLNGDGQILSLGNADIKLQESFKQTQAGQLQANNNLSLTTAGDIQNDGKINAGNTLKLSATNVNNSRDAQIESHDTQITAQDQINNTGLINGDYTTLKANIVNNQGSGRIYGTELAIGANTLNNLPDVNGQAPVIASRGDMNLGVQTLNNLANTTDYTSQALILSAGNMYLGGALDTNRKATGQASVINNESATIESLGDMRLSARQINNINRNFKTKIVEVSRKDGLEKRFSSWRTFDGELIDLKNPAEDFTKYFYSEIVSETQVTESAPGQIKAGGNMDLSGAQILNDKSKILAGGLFTITAGNLKSDDTKGIKETIATGIRQLYEVRSGSDYDEKTPFTYKQAAEIDLPISQALGNQKFNQSSISVTAVSNNKNGTQVQYSQVKQSHLNDLKDSDVSTQVGQAQNAQGKNISVVDTVNTSNNTSIQTGQQTQLTNRTKDIDAKITGSQSNVAQAVQANGQNLDAGHSVNISNNTQTQSVQQNQPTNQSKDLDAKISSSQTNVAQAGQAGTQNLRMGSSANVSNSTETQQGQQNQASPQAKDLSTSVTGSQSNVAQANQANEQNLNIGHSENVSNSTQTQQGQKNQVSQQSKDLNATIAESQLNVAQAGQVGGQNQVIKDGEQITNSSEINASQQNYPAQKSKDLSVAVDKYTQQKGHTADQTNTQEMLDHVNAPDQAADAVQYEIRTLTTSEVKVPNSALYRVNKDSKAGYLIETDPSFTNYKNWLSSDYMLDALGLDPALQQKRLADGFYEQRMVQDQIANLTGYRFLAGYTTDDEQYKALMNNGVTFAKQYGLRPGIALSADQVAQLTSDIVWLVEKDVILKDGTKAKALVPQVYVKARVGDLKGDGTLLSGNSIKFNLDGDLINGATIAGRQAVEITADNVHNLNGRIQGNQVAIEAKKDLNNIGGQIIAKDAMALKVGGNLKVETTTRTSTSQVGGFGSSITGVDRIAGLYVGNGSTLQPNQATLVVDVAGNTLLKGAQIKNNNGATLFNGTGNIDIGAVNIGKQEKLFIDNKNGYQLKQQSDIGSEISSNGTLVISGQNITGKAVHLTSQQGDIQLLAQKDIQLDNGLKQSIVDSKTEWKGSFGGKKSSTYNAHETVSLANQLTAGQNIIINSQQGNITATHLQANVGNNIQIQAEQGAVNLLSAIDEKSASSTSSKKNTATYNNRQSGYIDQNIAQTTLKAGNSVDINAGQSIELQANNIQAGQNIYVGNTLMQRQADGTLKAADGSLMPKNVTLSTLETHDQQWDEQQKGYRGVAKELVKGLAIGLPGLQAAAPGFDLQKKITVGESTSQRTEQIRQIGSSLNAANIAIGSSGQTTLTSADLTAKNVALSGQKVTLNAAEEQNIESRSHSIETIEGLGAKLNKDSIRLGGFVSEKDKNTLTTTETTHKAGAINTGNLIIKGTEGVDVLGQNIKATGDTTIDHGRGELNIGGYENKNITEGKTKNEKISAEVGVRNAYLDAALAVVAVKDAASALKDAKNAYSQAQRDYAAGKLTKEALDDSKANVAMATANLASAQIAVAASVAAAAANSGTYGFTIGANGEHIETTTTTTTTTQGQWQGSHLDLNNLTLKSEDQNANIQGSRLSATGTTTFNGTKDLNITAGIEHGSKESSSKTTSQSVSYTYGGGGGASIGKQTSKSQSESLTHVNSEVNLNRTEGQLNTLNIQGGEVSIADRGNLQVNQILVESLQDTAKSSNSSKGGSIGAGFGSSGISNVSASYNQSKGSSDSAWVNNTSKLIIGDKDHDANLDAMGVKQVTNVGGVIANATKNADGTLTDHKDLNYSGALELKDLQDHNYNSSRGFNVSTTIGKTTQEKDGEKGKYPNGSTTLGLQSNGQETEQLTKATMGLGTVKNTTELTNRDINTTQEITRDQTTGMLNGSVTVDHRLLSESGRAEIVQQQKDLPQNAEIVGKMTAAGVTSLGVATAALASGDQNLKQAYDTVMNPARTFDFVQKHPEAATVLEQFKNGDYDGLLRTKGSIQLLAQALGQDVDVLTTSMTSLLGIKGAYDHQTNTVVLDVNNENRSSILSTTGHEIAHGQGISNETSADLVGQATDWAFESGVKNNQGTIDQYKDQLGDGKDASTQAQNVAVLEKDNTKALDAISDHADQIDEKTSYWQDIKHLGCWSKECTVAYQKMDAAQEKAFRLGRAKAVTKFMNDIKNLPNVPKEVYDALTNDPMGTIEAIWDGVKNIPGELWQTGKTITKNNLVGSSPADFEKLGNAEMTVVLNAVSSGTVTVAKKGGKIVVEAAKKVKLKADFDPSLNVQTNGFSLPPKTTPKVIDLKAGSKGDWNKLANKPESNTIYKFENGYTYKTDANGRVSSVQADLELGKSDRNSYQQKVSGRADRAQDDHGGHLIASMFKGPGEGINIVPMDKTFNGSSGAWYQLESDWKKALENNQSVKVNIQPVYTGASKRPDSFIINQSINGIRQPSLQLKNTATGK